MLDDDDDDDEGLGRDSGADPSLDRPATARPRVRGLATAVLALLMAATSWVVASSASPWLVPPYLLLMALILSPSAGRRPDVPGQARSRSSTAPDPARPRPGTAGRSASGASPDEANATAPASAPAHKGRRGKGRPKKARPTAEADEATWVQVAPGKFVRVEAPTSAAEARSGPSRPVDPPAADAPAAFDLVEGPGVVPPAGVDPVTPTDAGPDARVDPTWPVADDEPSAADGTMPQAEGDLARPGPADRPEVPPESADERRATGPRFDPTETPVDETDLDDAEPLPDPLLAIGPDVDVDPVDAPPAEDASHGVVPEGPSWWPRLQAPGRRPRAGMFRAAGRGEPPRRPARSHGPSRRPPDPRRLTRRGAARPRQITRTFPPRSPPRPVSAAGRGVILAGKSEIRR